MTIQREMKRSEATIQWLDRQIDGVEIKSDDRTRLAACCLGMAREHHKALVLLVANSLVGSALALVRLIFEAYVRGIWLHRCASDREVARFKAGNPKKEFGILVQEIEKLEGFESVKRKEEILEGHEQLHAYRLCTSGPTHNRHYNRAELRRSRGVGGTALFAAIDFLSAIATADLAGNLKLANDVWERAKFVTTEPQPRRRTREEMP
jgi:hypothetical protein